MHYNIGRALERQGCPRSTLSAIAHHLVMSLPYGPVERAYDYTLHAGQQANQRLAYEEAILHYERALHLGGSRISPLEHCELVLMLGEAQALAGRWLESRQTFARAADEARQLGSARHVARAAIGFKGMMWATVPVDTEAVGLLREAAALLGNEDRDWLVQILSALSRCLYFANVPEEVAHYSQRAARLVEDLNKEELTVVALEAQITSLLGPTHVDEVFDLATVLLEKSWGSQHRDAAFNARLYRNYCCLTRGDVAGSDIEMGFAERLAGETRNVRHSWQVPMIRAGRALAAGRIDESIQLSDEARSLGERVHDSSPTHNYMVQVFQCARLREKFSDLDTPVALAQATYPDITGYRAAMAVIAAKQNDLPRARSILASFEDNELGNVGMDMLALWTLTLLVEAASICGEKSCAALLYKRLAPFWTCNIVMSWGSAFDGSVSHYLGIAASVCDDPTSAVRHFEHALTVNAATGSVPLLARTQLYYAETLLACAEVRNVDKGMQLLRGSLSTFEGLQMGGYADQARELLARASVRSSVAVSAASKEGGLFEGSAFELSADRTADGSYLFRREGQFWTIVFAGSLMRLRDTRGLAMLRILLEQPGIEFHVFDLITAVDGLVVELRNSSRRGRPRKSHSACGGDAGPVIDAQARAQYRRRAEELRAELVEADHFNDIGRADRLRAELEQVARELSRAYGQGGRLRVAAAASERARINVRNNVSTALSTVKRFDAALWRHLSAAVRTGAFCSYRPERPVPWSF
jgi:tetratricopeptide (TPR) repeat protein